MKVSEYVEKVRKLDERFKPSSGGKALSESMLEEASIWSNESAKGYTLLAMKQAGLSEEQIKSVLLEMSYLFEDVSVEEAEQRYNSR